MNTSGGELAQFDLRSFSPLSGSPGGALAAPTWSPLASGVVVPTWSPAPRAARRHITTWPSLRPAVQVSSGLLVVKYQHRLPPLERAQTAYDRSVFVASLPYSAVPTLALFAWWRDGNFQPLYNAIPQPPLAVRADLHDRT